MKTYITPHHLFLCQENEVIFTNRSAAVELAQVARLRFEFVNFHRVKVGPEWGTNGAFEGDYRHKISFVRSGAASLTCEGQRLDLEPGNAYWIPSSALVARHCDESFEEYMLTFHCQLIEGIDLFNEWPERRPFCVGAWNVDSWCAQWAVKPLSLNAFVRLQGQLFQWMSENFTGLDTIVTQQSRMLTRYARAFELTEVKLGANLRVSDLAQVQETSVEAFSKAFTRDFGISPKVFLNRRLNQEACRLISTTDWPIKTIAQHLGFSDEFYFSRFFSKMNRVSPSRYRGVGR